MVFNPFQERAFGIPPHYMILRYTPLTYIILYRAQLYYNCTVWYLSFAEVHMAPNPFQEYDVWHPISLHGIILSPIDIILYHTLLYYIVLSWRWHTFPFKKVDLTSHHDILYYIQSTYTTLYCIILCYTSLFKKCQFGFPSHYMILYYDQLTYTIPYHTIPYYTLTHDTILHNTMLCDAILYYTILYLLYYIGV